MAHPQVYGLPHTRTQPHALQKPLLHGAAAISVFNQWGSSFLCGVVTPVIILKASARGSMSMPDTRDARRTILPEMKDVAAIGVSVAVQGMRQPAAFELDPLEVRYRKFDLPLLQFLKVRKPSMLNTLLFNGMAYLSMQAAVNFLASFQESCMNGGGLYAGVPAS